MNERPPNNDATPRDGPDGISPEVRLIRDLGRAVQSLPFSDEPNTDPESIPQLLQPERLAGRTAIYAASLLDYNHGILHGAWLDAAVETEELQARIDRMLAESPTARQTGETAEEWAIHDHQGFGPAIVDEYAALEMVTRLAKRIQEHGPAYAAWVNLIAENLDDAEWAIDRFEDAYLGEWQSVTEYAEHLLDEFGLQEAIDQVVPESLRYYVKIDAEAFARDLELSGDITAVDRPEGGVWIFSS